MSYKRLTNEELTDFTSRVVVQLEPTLTQQVMSLILELTEYRTKIENGTLIELPCKVGDSVWFIPLYDGNPYCGVWEDKVQVVGMSSRGWHLKLRENHDHNKTYYLGKTVFLTKAEAEKKLKELKVVRNDL